jgi:hypothetical protein
MFIINLFTNTNILNIEYMFCDSVTHDDT